MLLVLLVVLMIGDFRRRRHCRQRHVIVLLGLLLLSVLLFRLLLLGSANLNSIEVELLDLHDLLGLLFGPTFAVLGHLWWLRAHLVYLLGGCYGRGGIGMIVGVLCATMLFNIVFVNVAVIVLSTILSFAVISTARVGLLEEFVPLSI